MIRGRLDLLGQVGKLANNSSLQINYQLNIYRHWIGYKSQEVISRKISFQFPGKLIVSLIIKIFPTFSYPSYIMKQMYELLIHCSQRQEL